MEKNIIYSGKNSESPVTGAQFENLVVAYLILKFSILILSASSIMAVSGSRFNKILEIL